MPSVTALVCAASPGFCRVMSPWTYFSFAGYMLGVVLIVLGDNSRFSLLVFPQRKRFYDTLYVIVITVIYDIISLQCSHQLK